MLNLHNNFTIPTHPDELGFRGLQKALKEAKRNRQLPEDTNLKQGTKELAAIYNKLLKTNNEFKQAYLKQYTATNLYIGDEII